jgi:uncharacterized membrane protein YkvI
MQTAEFIHNFRMIMGFVMAAVGLGAALSTTVGMLLHLSDKQRVNYPILTGALFAIFAPIGLATIPYPYISKYWPAGILLNPMLIFIIIMLIENSENKKNNRKK